MRDDEEDELTPAEQLRYLLASIRHTELLHKDAVACGLSSLAKKRRQRLQVLRQQFADLDAQDVNIGA